MYRLIFWCNDMFNFHLREAVGGRVMHNFKRENELNYVQPIQNGCRSNFTRELKNLFKYKTQSTFQQTNYRN